MPAFINNKFTIACLCIDLGDDTIPLTKKQFWSYYEQVNYSLEAMYELDDYQIKVLLQRSNKIKSALSKLYKKKIQFVTFQDEFYPSNLLTKLGNNAEPMFYYTGDLTIQKHKFVGYAGARDIDTVDRDWIFKMIKLNMIKKFNIVSGGARGTDSIAVLSGLKNGLFAIEFLAGSIEERMHDSRLSTYLEKGKLLLFTTVSPFKKLNRQEYIISALNRNQFIYAFSSATVVVKAKPNKGGSWAGATHALKHNHCKVYVWDQKKYLGNQKLIEKGATGLSDDGLITSEGFNQNDTIKKNIQLSFFE